MMDVPPNTGDYQRFSDNTAACCIAYRYIVFAKYSDPNTSTRAEIIDVMTHP